MLWLVRTILCSCNLQVDLSSLQQQLQVVRDAPADAEIAPSLAAISDLLGQVAAPDAAAAAARLVADVVEGREASGEAPSLMTCIQRVSFAEFFSSHSAGHALIQPGRRRSDLLACRRS